MNTPSFRLAISKAVINKAARDEFVLLSSRLTPAVFTPEDLLEHLTIMGHPICCAELATDERSGFAKRDHSSFVSSQVVGIDIDQTDVPFEAIEQDPWLREHASFAYTTPSHSEESPRYRIMFVLAKAITKIDEYRALMSTLIDKFGGDPNTKDAVRIWFGSVNAKTIIWGKTLSERTVQNIVKAGEELQTEERIYRTFATSGLTFDDVQEMLRVIPPKLAHIDWKKIVSAVADAIGDGPQVERLLEQWSPSEIPYSYVLKHRLEKVTAGTLIWHAKQHGWRPRPGLYNESPKTTVETLDKVETFLRSGYDFRKNAITNHIEIRSSNSTKWERISDYWINSEVRRIRAAGLKVSTARLHEIVDSDFSPTFDPIKNYFDNLVEWRAGDRDFIGDLIRLIPPAAHAGGYTMDGQQHWYDYVIRKWIVACVACAVHHKPNHTMIVLQGDQGVGKTTFLRNLCPDEFRRDHYYEGMITGEKDVEIKLSQSFIAVDDELETMTKKSSDLIKQVITKDQHSVRHPYAHYSITTPRRVSFAGSVNKRTFLSDETGSRRFPVVAIGGNIDLKALGAIDVDRIWAQAKALYESGFQYWWDAADTERLAKWNGQFETTTYADDLVFKWCKPVDDEQRRPRLSATEIMQAISRKEFDLDKNIVTVTPQLVKDMGRALVRAGYKARGQRHQGHMKTGYSVEILDTPRKAFAQEQDVKAEDLF